MTALAADRQTPERELHSVYLPVAANTRIFAGSLVAINSSGDAVPVTNTGSASTLRVIGRAADHVDNRTDVEGPGLAGSLSVKVEYGVFLWANLSDSISLANLGAACYAQDDQTVHLSSDGGDRPVAGRIVDVDDEGVWVESMPTLLTAGEGALLAANDLDDVDSAVTARGNLGVIQLLLAPSLDLIGANAAQFRYVHSGPDATINHIRSVLSGALTTGNATITASIDGVAVTNGVVTITQAGSAEDDVDAANPSAANVISEGEVLTLTVGGTNDAARFANVTIELSY
jgi:hypothetical protein